MEKTATNDQAVGLGNRSHTVPCRLLQTSGDLAAVAGSNCEPRGPLNDGACGRIGFESFLLKVRLCMGRPCILEVACPLDDLEVEDVTESNKYTQ